MVSTWANLCGQVGKPLATALASSREHGQRRRFIITISACKPLLHDRRVGVPALMSPSCIVVLAGMPLPMSQDREASLLVKRRGLLRLANRKTSNTYGPSWLRTAQSLSINYWKFPAKVANTTMLELHCMHSVRYCTGSLQ